MKCWFSRLSPTEHDILDIIEDNSFKTQDIQFNLVAFDSTRLKVMLGCKL